MVKDQSMVNVQDQFLNRIRREKIRVTLELIDGHKVEGVVVSFDNFSLHFRSESDRLIYKHAIASLTVAGKLDLDAGGPTSAVSSPKPGMKG